MACNCGKDPHEPTCPEFSGVRGMDDKRRLLGFFAQKGHHNLVLRVVDVLDLADQTQANLIGMVAINRDGGLPEVPGGDLKGWWLQQYPGGYITIPINKLLEPLPLKEVAVVQQVVAEYRDVRMGKGSPSRKDLCVKCHGKGCSDCHEGYVYTFLEMDEYEVELAKKEIG